MTNRPRRIPEVRFVGVAWYDRGGYYWWLRFWMSALWFVVMVAVVAVVGIVVNAMFTLFSSTSGRILAVSVCAIVVIGSCLSTYAQLARTQEERKAHFPVSFPERDDAPIKGMAGIGITAAGGATLMGAFLSLSSLFLIGYAIGMFCTTLGRYLTVREWEAARAYGLEPELPDQSDEFREAHPLVPRHILLGDY